MTPDPLYVALATALTPYGPVTHTAIRDAADAALRVLGGDRCTHQADTHQQHHTSPVDGCPWCAAGTTTDDTEGPL